MVASVGAACLDARALRLRGVSIVLSTACAKNKNSPVTSWMKFFPALSSYGVLSIGFVDHSFAPYVFLTLECGWSCWIRGGGCWKHFRAFWTYVGIKRCTLRLL
jgi:hypothetical protein